MRGGSSRRLMGDSRFHGTWIQRGKLCRGIRLPHLGLLAASSLDAPAFDAVVVHLPPLVTVILLRATLGAALQGERSC